MYSLPPDGVGSGGARELPMCVALILCDQVIEDRRTGNKSLISLFSDIVTDRLPALHSRMFLVASVTSGRGTWPFSFVVTSPNGKELMRMQDTVHITDPLQVLDLVVEVRNLPLESPGVHFIDFLLGDTPLANRRFTVQLNQEGE